MKNSQDPFANAELVAAYAEETSRKVPGLGDLHRMTMLLLSEQARQEARILVVGAGGGMELLALSKAQPTWTFIGVDPSREMLDLAIRNLSPIRDRIELVQGTIDVVPLDESDGATCLLMLHFLDRRGRLHVLKEIHRRLKAGARLVMAHHSMGGVDATRWLTRTAAFADRAGQGRDKASHLATRWRTVCLCFPHQKRRTYCAKRVLWMSRFFMPPSRLGGGWRQ